MICNKSRSKKPGKRLTTSCTTYAPLQVADVDLSCARSKREQQRASCDSTAADATAAATESAAAAAARYCYYHYYCLSTHDDTVTARCRTQFNAPPAVAYVLVLHAELIADRRSKMNYFTLMLVLDWILAVNYIDGFSHLDQLGNRHFASFRRCGVTSGFVEILLFERVWIAIWNLLTNGLRIGL